jgi:trans-aconitate methyltransferase
MLAKGKDSPGGDAPNLSWIHGEAESAAVDPPYGLITAASSLHWMEWAVVLPRFAQILTPAGVLAIVFEHVSGPSEPYANQIGGLVLESLTNRAIPHREPWDLIEELQERDLFVVRDEAVTEPVFQEQQIDDFVESIHARTNFSRERMGAESAADFDSRAKKILLAGYPAGSLTMSVQTKVIWGRPLGTSP